MYAILRALSLLVLFRGFRAISATENAICHSGPTSSAKCVNVENKWERLRNIINNARDGDEIIFCPFRIEIAGDPAKPSRKATFACQEKGACTVYGEGQAIVINHPRAETLLWGFQFQDSTEAAIHIRDDSKEVQTICSCTFRRNHHVQQRGGAIRSDRHTNVAVFQCTFSKNIASRGGSIYVRGHLNITKSIFEDNHAEQGGAIGFASYAYLFLQDNVFFRNSAYSGANIYGEVDDGHLNVHYNDGGGNIAASTSCNGLYNRVTGSKKCYEFELQTASPSSPPSFTPSSFPTVSPQFVTKSTNLPSAYPTAITPIPSLLPTLSPQALVEASNQSKPPAVIPTNHPSRSMMFSNPSATTVSSSVSEKSSPENEFAPSWQPTTTAANTLPTMYTLPFDRAGGDLPLVDRNQTNGYYNFNVNDLDFGPKVWSKINVTNNEYSRYAQVGLEVSINQCGAGGEQEQTPIDLNYTNRECKEFHQIRARGGKWKNLTQEGEITFHILPSHLRIQIDSEHPKAPRADSPGGFVELYADHVEITTPSLHTIDGIRFDAEYSIYHVQGSLNRILVMSVVVDASQNIHNEEFQKVLNAFWKVDDCGITNSSKRGGNRNLSKPDQTPKANIAGKFNLYNIEMVPSIHWFAYDGSLPRVSTVAKAVQYDIHRCNLEKSTSYYFSYHNSLPVPILLIGVSLTLP
mmetsp:Transcript_31028/g.47321  ORF Transcript_31028/g.47321 Transcript_31028/m.47321 type:complete len:691 (-) Transcript_31028:240-2312(-)